MRRDLRYVVATVSLLLPHSAILYIARTDSGEHYLTESLDDAALSLDPEDAGQLLCEACIEEPRRQIRSWRVYDVEVTTEEVVVKTRKLLDKNYPPQLRLPLSVTTGSFEKIR